MIGIEEFTFLEMRIPLSNVHFRVTLRVGDELFFRNDIAHIGSDNTSDFTHYRLYYFIDAKEYNLGDTNENNNVMAAAFVYGS